MITFYLLNWSKENCNFETQWNSMIENIGTHRTYCSFTVGMWSSFYSTVKYEKRLSNGYKLYLNGFAKLVSLSSSINSIWMNTDEKKHDITKHKNSRCEYVHQRKYHNIFEIHLLVHLYFLGFNPCILNIYSLISCSVFQNVHAQYFKMFMLCT